MLMIIAFIYLFIYLYFSTKPSQCKYLLTPLYVDRICFHTKERKRNIGDIVCLFKIIYVISKYHYMYIVGNKELYNKK